MSWINADGLEVLMHGEQGKVKKNGGTTRSIKQTLIVDVEGTEVPSTADTPEANDAFIPAGAYITGAYLIVEEAFTSGGAATMTIGTYEKDGTTIDADGVDVAVALTAVNAEGKVVKNDGAQVAGAATVGSADAYVKVNYGTAAYTGGKAKLFVEYIPR